MDERTLSRSSDICSGFGKHVSLLSVFESLADLLASSCEAKALAVSKVTNNKANALQCAVCGTI